MSTMVMANACASLKSNSAPPVKYNGTVGDTYRVVRGSEGDVETMNLLTGSLAFNSHIWRNWAVQVGGDTNLVYGRQNRPTDDGRSVRADGSLIMSILPYSPIPTTLTYDRRDDFVSGQSSQTGSTGSLSKNRYSVTSKVPLPLGLWPSGKITYEDLNQGGVGSEERLEYSVSGGRSFGRHNVSAQYGHRTRSFDAVQEGDFDSLIRDASLTHSFSPSEQLRIQNVVSYHDTNELLQSADTVEQHNAEIQAYGSVNWRPESRPIRVNAFYRFQSEEREIEYIDSDQLGQKSNRQTGNAIATLTYPIRPNLSAFASAGVTYVEGAPAENAQDPINAPTSIETGEPDLIYRLSGGMGYSSKQRKIKGFDWKWQGSGQGAAEYSDNEGLGATPSVKFGQSLSKEIYLWRIGKTRFRASQNLFGQYISLRDEADVNITHFASLAKRRNLKKGNSNTRLTFNDRRSFSSQRRAESQTLDLRYSRADKSNRKSQWQGTVTAQFARTKMGDKDAELNLNVNGDVTYIRRSLFDVRNLTLRSTLRLTPSGLEDVLLDKEESRGIQDSYLSSEWRSIVTYPLGRLVMGTEFKVTQRDDKFATALEFRIRRAFAGTTG